MNASNILAMTKDVIYKHNDVVPQDWKAIKEFPGVGPKIASVVAYEAFGINHIPVDVDVLDFPSFLVGAPIMHQLKNVKKILKVGCLLTTGIWLIVQLAASVN
jgi:adenine-specific DNA glycosylase